MMSTKKKLSSPIFYTVAWISALPIERAAATAMLDEHHDEPDAFERNGNDSNAYDWGAIGQHNIVIASLQAGIYGTASAATTASQLLSSLPHIRIGLMVGIGGGIPQSDRDIRLGDIVIGQPDGSTGGVVQYDLGRAKANQTWEQKGALNMPPPVLLNALSKLQANHEMDEPMIMGLLDGMIKKKPRMKQQYKHQGIKNDRLFSPDYDHVGGNTCDGCDSSGEVKRPERDSIDPEIHYGIIASGNTLVKDAATRDSLVQRVGEECLCFEMEAAGLANTFPCLVIRGISDYADSHKNFQWQRYASATAAAFAVELLGYVPVRQLEETPRALEVMNTIDQKITNLNESFQAFVSKTVLSRLPAARGAAYDSSDDWLEATCMKNTRVSILNEIHEWANDPTSTTLFWLNGMAGTGKSTISRTVAQRLAAAGNLGGSFFFKKGEADRSNPSKLFTTLAAGLLRWQPAVSRYIERAIDENPQIFDQIYEDQFEKLIFEPLSEATPPPERPIVMVVDALDECQNVVITRIITDILPRAASLQHIRLKFFLTSRPEMAVQAGFSKVQPKSTYRDFLLHNVSHDVIKKDLEIFLTATIAHIRDRFNSLRHGSSMIPPNWPSQDVIDRLVDMAIPLFIVAATVCRFVDDQRLGNPKRQIKQVLALRDREHESMLDQMYLTVLNQQFGDDYSLRKKHQIIEEFRRIVGSVILLSSPLTIPALARLLRKDGDDDDLQSTIEDRLEILHSVLSVPQPEERPCVPVRVLHSSFRDFLVDPQHRASNSFWVDEAKTHMALWESCLGVMKAALRQDMCGLGLPATSQASIEREAVDDCLPPELQYACLYWIDHIEQAGVDSATGLSILTFFKENLFHWLEALSLMGRSYESVDMIERLKDISTNASCSQLSDFLDDTTRFIGHNSHTIATTPLQIYSSAVVFAPMKSIVRETFKAHVPDWILIQPSGEDRWNPFLQGLETWGETFVFSPNSKFIALQAGNMVQIWRVNTGKCLQVLECSGSSLASPLAFSADSNMLVTPFENWIQVWRVDTGQCIQQFEHLESEVCSVVLSPRDIIASGSKSGEIRVWEAKTGQLLSELKGHGHEKEVRALAFSPDLRLLASGSDDGTTRIWQTDTWTHVRTLMAPETDSPEDDSPEDGAPEDDSSDDDLFDRFPWMRTPSRKENWIMKRQISSIAFSTDSRLIASAKPDTIVVWASDSGQLLQVITTSADKDLKFLTESTLVSGKSGRSVGLLAWDAVTGEFLRGAWGDIDSCVLAPSGSMIAASDCGSGMAHILEFSDSYGDCLQRVGRHIDDVRRVAISADAKFMATTANEGLIRLWEVHLDKDARHLDKYQLWAGPRAISPDLSLAASASRSILMIWQTATGRCLHELQVQQDSISRLSFSPDSKLLLSVDGDVLIWNPESGRQIARMPGGYSAATFSPTSELIAVGGGGVIKIWRVATGERIQTIPLPFQEDRIISLAFSADSTQIVSGTVFQDKVMLWDIPSRTLLLSISCRDFGQPSAVAIATDLSLMAAATTEGLFIWSATTGDRLETVARFEHNKMFSQLSFNADKTRLHTDMGVFAMQAPDSPTHGVKEIAPGDEAQLGMGISENEEWITWCGHRLLLLPRGFHDWARFAVRDSLVMSVNNVGRALFVKFDPDKLANIYQGCAQ